MSIINAKTIKVEEFNESAVPRYGILSHTWEDSELLFQEIELTGVESIKGYAKVERNCQLAASKGLNYSSSSELSEAINSMLRWYMNADICFVYLSDLDQVVSTKCGLKPCRWFKRGWTLQELIAHSNIEFYDAAWNLRGNKQGLEKNLHPITGIDKNVLRNSDSLSNIPIAKKIPCVCLLGIFDVNMPLIYGEGCKAFLRLQEEIIKTTHDLTIFG
ncbi:hypothetical protein NA56DRAFT_681188 [Hyaloscypha hepaticicola]|uniref:Heterokaryon incompatibility domain-containing protein n=1 Tax=Hyaloscypha hepaticicola TaxID=2082293 RepID=A0A2J6PTJ8_9HELO|nr:hypothetical protein NA56DRAFT_681188 [Hyaloscypha hepaticicola]